MDGPAGPGLTTLVIHINKALHRRIPESALGIGMKELMTLGYIRDRKGISQQELGEAMLLDANTVVLLLNRLEDAGYSVRRRDPDDRRRHLVEVTPAGIEAIDRAEKARESLEAELLSELSAEERETLHRLLVRLLESLSRTPTAAAAGADPKGL